MVKTRSYLFGVARVKYPDFNVKEAYDAGNGSILMIMERKDKKPVVDNAILIDSNGKVHEYSLVMDPKKTANIFKHPIAISR